MKYAYRVDTRKLCFGKPHSKQPFGTNSQTYRVTCPALNVIVTSKDSLLNGTICNVFLQFNILRLCNNVLIHWCWLLLLLLLLLAAYCQRVELLTFWFLPHSTVVEHSTNNCSSDEWNRRWNNNWNSYTGWTWWAVDTLTCRKKILCDFVP